MSSFLAAGEPPAKPRRDGSATVGCEDERNRAHESGLRVTSSTPDRLRAGYRLVSSEGQRPEIDQASVMNEESFWITQTVSNWVPPRILWPVQAVPAECRMPLARGRSRINLSAHAHWPFLSAMRSCRISISTWGIFRRSP